MLNVDIYRRGFSSDKKELEVTQKGKLSMSGICGTPQEGAPYPIKSCPEIATISTAINLLENFLPVSNTNLHFQAKTPY